MVNHLAILWRTARSSPGNYFALVLSLAPGLFGSVVVFALVNAVSIQELPYENAERLVVVWEDNSLRGAGLTPTSLPNYLDLREGLTTFDDVAVYTDAEFNLTDGLVSERVRGLYATATLLGLTGVEPILGRTLQATDDLPASPNVAVLSYALWQQSFGADPNTIGQTVLLNDEAHTVVGVMPSGFVLPPGFSATVVSADMVMRPPDLWVPLKPRTGVMARNLRYIFALARVRQDRTLAQAQAELDTVASQLATQYPDANRGLQFAMLPLQGQVMGSLSAVLPLFVTAAGLVFVIAGMNGLAVSVAAAAQRNHEWAIRVALGATPLQLYVEALGAAIAAAVGAGALGSAVAYAFLAALRVSGDGIMSGLSSVRVDGLVWLFAAVLTTTIGFALALVPVLVTRREGLPSGFGGEGTRTTGSRRTRLIRRGVLVLQVALAVVVVTLALQLVVTFNRLSDVNPGLDPRNLVALEFTLPERTYSDQPLRARFQRDLLEAVEGIPGVVSATTVDYVPFGENIAIVNLTVEALAPQPSGDQPRALWRTVSRNYFRTLSIPLLDGREFTESDRIDAAPVAIVNAEFVRRFFPEGTAIGRRIKRGRADAGGAWMTVVGVTGAVRSTGLGLAPQAEIVVPYTQWSTSESVTLVARTEANALGTLRAIGRVSGEVDARVPPSSVRYLESMIAESIGRPRFHASLLVVFAGLALVLALAGTYGLSAALVSIRRREIGLRICLGAPTGGTVVTVAGESLGCVAVGTLVGLASSVLTAGALSSVFVGLDASDGGPYVASALLMVIAGMMVNVAPVRRALAMEPAAILTEAAGAGRR